MAKKSLAQCFKHYNVPPEVRRKIQADIKAARALDPKGDLHNIIVQTLKGIAAETEAQIDAYKLQKNRIYKQAYGQLLKMK